jgi:hypothetical protein
MKLDEAALIKLATEYLVGYGWQWTRSFKHTPNWVGYTLFGTITIFAWVWMTPDAFVSFASNWRVALANVAISMVSMITGARGAGGTMADTKIAPKTDSKAAAVPGLPSSEEAASKEQP